MKISVLLPTRDRLELLRHAVESVRRQRHDDWEIVVSDNASTEDVAGYVRSLGDSRIVYLRHDRFLSVTDNWNAALAGATGDYVIMLGDDDALLGRFMERIVALAQMHALPDVIFCNAYFYAYPGAVAGHPDGFVKKDRSPIFARDAPFELPRETALHLVRRTAGLFMDFPFNMQFSVFHRRMLERLRDGILFRSPYPDYYATNELFLLAERILVVPDPLVVIGISTKSYGFLHFQGQESKGSGLHGTDHLFAEIPGLDDVLLPGSRSLNCFLVAAEWLARTAPPGCPIVVDRRRYRRRQIRHVCARRFVTHDIDDATYADFLARLTPAERWVRMPALRAATFVHRLLGDGVRAAIGRLVARKDAGALDFTGTTPVPPTCRNIIDACDLIAATSRGGQA